MVAADSWLYSDVRCRNFAASLWRLDGTAKHYAKQKFASERGVSVNYFEHPSVVDFFANIGLFYTDALGLVS
jgi:hypothetical protein